MLALLLAHGCRIVDSNRPAVYTYLETTTIYTAVSIRIFAGNAMENRTPDARDTDEPADSFAASPQTLPQNADEPAAPAHVAPPTKPSKATKQEGSCLASLLGWLLVAMVVLVLAGVGITLLLLFGERELTGRIYPHVNVRGVDVGLYRPMFAEDVVEEAYADFYKNPVHLVYGEQTWQPSAAELGVSVNITRAVAHAATLGRDENRLRNARAMAAIWTYGFDVPLEVQIDEQAVQAYVLQVAQEIEVAPRNADLRLNGAQVLVTSARTGQQVLVDQTVRDIVVALQTMQPQPVIVRTRRLSPMVENTDIAPIVAQVRALFSQPLIVSVGPEDEYLCANLTHCSWQWSPEQVAHWVALRRSYTPEGMPEYTIHIDRTAMQRSLLPVADMLRKDGNLPRIDWNNGNPYIFQEGTKGRGVDATLAVERMYTALHDGGVFGPRVVSLPISDTPPPVIQSNIAELGITELIGAGVSSFLSSAPYRITNIRAGARRMHGVVLAPGDYFSFNQALGPVNGYTGFVQGSAIVGNRTQMEWGGGLCQVSTTMFRAAFWTGLEIVERHEHRFRISWYEELGEPPGLDATIFTGVADFRFRNDTDGYILIQAYVDLNRQRLTVAMYGNPAYKRDVSMGHAVLSRTPPPSTPLYIDDPTRPRGYFKQTDWAIPGLTAEVYRTVRHNGQLIHQNAYRSVFEPWPNIYVRGTG